MTQKNRGSHLVNLPDAMRAGWSRRIAWVRVIFSYEGTSGDHAKLP
jgi:hypothetical protein